MNIVQSHNYTDEQQGPVNIVKWAWSVTKTCHEENEILLKVLSILRTVFLHFI